MTSRNIIRKARHFDHVLLFIYHLPPRPYTKKEVVTALRRYFGPLPDDKPIPYEWALQDPNDEGTPTKIMLRMKDPTLIDRICQNTIHVIEICRLSSIGVSPTKHLIGVSKLNRSRTLIVTPKFPNHPKHSNKREIIYTRLGAHAEFIGDWRFWLNNPKSHFIVFPTLSAALSALPELQKHNTAVFCDQTICHSWFKVVGTLSNASLPPSPDRIEILNDIAQNIRSFFISEFSATHVLFDLSETSPFSSFEVFFPETENGEQQAKAAVTHCSKQDPTSPSSNLAERILKQYTVRHPITRPDPAKQPPHTKLLPPNLTPKLSPYLPSIFKDIHQQGQKHRVPNHLPPSTRHLRRQRVPIPTTRNFWGMMMPLTLSEERNAPNALPVLVVTD
ncbi:hypothetical protein BLNAU_20489 [Blattamonas nauphoetae]|uniref:Uncharacterized protein n=1 Tax=Blattamonas nauphoetae TaxID=2049346 RepID=A0ABQ9WYK2_9EUKA|nr:hypothetical protein BLNAU_20489 [Blattamonas nauphoetae]